MSIQVTVKHPKSGEEKQVIFDDKYLLDVIETDPDRVYDALNEQICKCQPVGETNVVECGCFDYVVDFEIKEFTIKAVQHHN